MATSDATTWRKACGGFSKWSNIEGFEEKYYDYAGGWNLTNRMPWSVEPKKKLNVKKLLNKILLISYQFLSPHSLKFHRIVYFYLYSFQVRDIMEMMRDHNDNTKLDMISDIGAGRWKNAFRERPLTWHGPGEGNEAMYINERTIGTQQTYWHFVVNLRNFLPDHVGGVIWFGVDDVTFSPHIPFYPYANVPKAIATGTGK